MVGLYEKLVSQIRRLFREHSIALAFIGLALTLIAGTYNLGVTIGNNREDFLQDQVSLANEAVSDKSKIVDSLNAKLAESAVAMARQNQASNALAVTALRESDERCAKKLDISAAKCDSKVKASADSCESNLVASLNYARKADLEKMSALQSDLDFFKAAGAKCQSDLHALRFPSNASGFAAQPATGVDFSSLNISDIPRGDIVALALQDKDYINYYELATMDDEVPINGEDHDFDKFQINVAIDSSNENFKIRVDRRIIGAGTGQTVVARWGEPFTFKVGYRQCFLQTFANDQSTVRMRGLCRSNFIDRKK